MCPLGLSFLHQAWFEPLLYRTQLAGSCNDVRKAQNKWAECRPRVYRCGRAASNTWDKYSQISCKAQASIRISCSFLYEPLEEKDNSNCSFTDDIRGRLGFPEPWKCGFGNSILSLFNLLFYVFPLDYKAFKEKCCSTDKQVITIFRESKCLLSVIVENKQGGHL